MSATVHSLDSTRERRKGQGRFRCHPKQARFLLSRTRFSLALAGIRGGKTEAGALKTLLFALQHPCRDDEYHFVTSPTYDMSKVPRDKMMKLLHDRSIFPVSPLIRYAKTDRTFHLAANGGVTRVRLFSMDDPDKMRGFRALSAWPDEAAFQPEYAWTVLLGRLSDTRGPAWLTTTPNGYNWVFELYERARNGDADVSVSHWTSRDNPFISREGISDLATRYDSKTYLQEVEALFVRSSGLAYHAFRRDVHVRPGRIQPNQELWVGQDFNVDPMSSVFAQPMRTAEGVEGAHILSERVAPDSDTYGLVRFTDDFIRRHHIPKEKVTFYVDASGRARKTSATRSDVQILRGAGYRVRHPPANPLVKDRVNCINGLFRPQLLRHPRLVVSPDCPVLIESFEKQKWKEGSSPPELDKTQGFDHITDAAGYLGWGRWPIRPSASIGTRRAA